MQFGKHNFKFFSGRDTALIPPQAKAKSDQGAKYMKEAFVLKGKKPSHKKRIKDFIKSGRLLS
jgi:hypothetical protein